MSRIEATAITNKDELVAALRILDDGVARNHQASQRAYDDGGIDGRPGRQRGWNADDARDREPGRGIDGWSNAGNAALPGDAARARANGISR